MKRKLEEIIFRDYKDGDETKIVHFLNFCYEKWGDLRMWRYLYPNFPSFDSTNIRIAEHNGKIVGHGSMHARDLVISQNCKLSAVIFSAGAVHPHYRRIGLHSRLLNQRLQIAKSNGVSLAFGWTQKDSGAYKSDTKIGFVEIRQSAVYMKIVRPDKIFQLGLIDLLSKNQKLRKIRIASFRNMNKIQIVSTLLPLFLFTRLKIKFSSFRTFLSIIKKGVQIIGAL
jgi:N-acetylglutamate synthase-like GNAT family acetyltransferase